MTPPSSMESPRTFEALEEPQNDGRAEIHEGFYVDIGESDPFHVSVGSCRSYEVLNATSSSMVVFVVFTNGAVAVLRVNWSTKRHVADTRGRIAAEICSDVVRTPRLLSRQLYLFGGTYVMVVLREYIDGVPASELWEHMSAEEKVEISQQVSRAVVRMSSHTSETFGALQGRGLKSVSPVSFLNHKIVVSKLSCEIDHDDVGLLGDEDFKLKAVLCHGNLGLEHVIIKLGRVVGLVGWSKADFVPEVYDRLNYTFRVPNKEEWSWEGAMANVPFSHDLPPSEYLNHCIRYMYAVHSHSLTSQPLSLLSSIRAELLTAVLETPAGKAQSDARSRTTPLAEQEWDSETVSSFDFDDLCTSILGTEVTQRTALAYPLVCFSEDVGFQQQEPWAWNGEKGQRQRRDQRREE